MTRGHRCPVALVDVLAQIRYTLARAGCFERASGGTLFLDELPKLVPT
jgi:hypothetical protein